MAAPAAAASSASTETLSKLLRGLRIGVNGSSGSSDGRDDAATGSQAHRPPDLPLTDQLSLLSAHIDSVRGQIAATAGSEQGRTIIAEHVRRARKIQSRLRSLDARLRSVRDTNYAGEEQDAGDALRETVLHDFAAYTEAHKAAEQERNAGQLARTLYSAVAAVEDVEGKLSVRDVDLAGVSAALAHVDECSSRLGLGSSSASSSRPVEGHFTWIGASGSILPQAIGQLSARIDRVKVDFVQILETAWRDMITVQPASGATTSFEVKHHATVTSTERTHVVSLQSLTNVLHDRNDLTPRIQRLARTLLDQIIKPMLDTASAQAWTLDVDDHEGKWSCTAQSRTNNNLDRRKDTIDAVVSLMELAQRRLLNDATIPDSTALGHAFSKFLLPPVVQLIVANLRSMLPTQLGLSTEGLTTAKLELEKLRDFSQQCHSRLKECGLLQYGLAEDAEDLVDFGNHIWRIYTRQLGVVARANCRDILLKEQDGGWESVPVEMDVHISASQAAETLALANAAEDHEAEKLLDAGNPIPSTVSNRQSGQMYEEDSWDAWGEDEGPTETKNSPARTVLHSSADPGSRSHTPTSPAPGLAKLRQKKSALGGVRVIKPQDELGSGPFPAVADADIDDDGWGFDDELVAPESTSTLSNVPAPRVFDDADDAWFQDEVLPAPTSALQETPRPSASGHAVESTNVAHRAGSEEESEHVAIPDEKVSLPSRKIGAPMAMQVSSLGAVPPSDFDEEDIDEDAWGLSEEEKVELAAKRASILEARRSRTDLTSAFTFSSDLEAQQHAQGDVSDAAHLFSAPEEGPSDTILPFESTTTQDTAAIEEGIEEGNTSSLQDMPSAFWQPETTAAVASQQDQDDVDDPWDMSPISDSKPMEVHGSATPPSLAQQGSDDAPKETDAEHYPASYVPAQTVPTVSQETDKADLSFAGMPESSTAIEDADPWDFSPTQELQNNRADVQEQGFDFAHSIKGADEVEQILTREEQQQQLLPEETETFSGSSARGFEVEPYSDPDRLDTLLVDDAIETPQSSLSHSAESIREAARTEIVVDASNEKGPSVQLEDEEPSIENANLVDPQLTQTGTQIMSDHPVGRDAHTRTASSNETQYASVLFADVSNEGDPWDTDVLTPLAEAHSDAGQHLLPEQTSKPTGEQGRESSRHESDESALPQAIETFESPANAKSIMRREEPLEAAKEESDDAWDLRDDRDDVIERNDVLSGSEGTGTGGSGEKSISSGEKLSDVQTEAWEEFANSDKDSQQLSRSSSRGPHASTSAFGASAPAAGLAIGGALALAAKPSRDAGVSAHASPKVEVAQASETREQSERHLSKIEPENSRIAAPKAQSSELPQSENDQSQFDAWGWDDDVGVIKSAERSAATPQDVFSEPPPTNATDVYEQPREAIVSPPPRQESEKEDTQALKETMLVSQRSLAFLQLVSTIMDDIILFSKSSEDSPLPTMDASALVDALRDMLDLHQAMMPVSHAETLRNVPTLAAQFANDCAYIAKELQALDARWKEASKALPSSHALGDLSLMKHAERATTLGLRSFDAQVLIQQQALAECLAETLGFEATHEDGRFRACQRSMQQVVTIIKQLGRAWSPPVLGNSRYLAAMGRIVDSVLRRLLRDISSLEDISEVEGNRLAELLKMTTELEDLFRRGTAPGRTPMLGQESESASDVAVHVPSWFKASYLVDILTGSLVDIEFLYFEAHALVDYSKSELVRLIRALFSESPKRARLLDRIQSA